LFIVDYLKSFEKGKFRCFLFVAKYFRQNKKIEHPPKTAMDKGFRENNFLKVVDNFK